MENRMKSEHGPHSHAVMPSGLAKALIEAGVKHYDLGGLIGDVLNPVTGLIKGIGSSLTTTNPYQATLAPTTQSSFAPTIAQAQTNALAVNPQQQALASALLAQSQGQGPNPAQAALNQNTGANIAGQAALMAGQRGASANPALLAREIAMQGANTQQQAVGQGATLQAQQQLGAQNALQNLYGEQQTGANQLLNTAAVAQNQQNTGQIQNYGMQQGITSGVNQANTTSQNQMTGGLLGGIGAGLSAFTGGAKKYAGGPATDLSDGGGVPGQSAHPGNDPRNDIVPALLSKGEVVLPNSVTQSPNASKKAQEFMQHLQGEKDKKYGYEKVASAKRTLKERVDHLEKLCMGGYS